MQLNNAIVIFQIYMGGVMELLIILAQGCFYMLVFYFVCIIVSEFTRAIDYVFETPWFPKKSNNTIKKD